MPTLCRGASPLLAILVALAPIGATDAAAAGVRECDSYARRAVNQFATMQRVPRCRLHPDRRWQSNYANHHDWCLSAPIGSARSEQHARDDHLRRCGGQTRID
jgi:hypothetical protein